MGRYSALVCVGAWMLGAAGCVSTTVDAGRVEAVDRLAIVGFEVSYVVESGGRRTGTGGFATAANIATDVAKGVSGAKDKERRDAGNWAYDRLVEMLGEVAEARVLSRQDLYRNRWYRSQYKAKGEPPGFDVATAQGVIGYRLLEEWTTDERDAYIERLGVDAVAAARVKWVTGTKRPKGWWMLVPWVEEVRPAAIVTLAVYERGRAEPVWEEVGAMGCPSDEGLGDIGGVEVWRDMRPILDQATEYGYETLLSRYAEAAAAGKGIGVTASTFAKPFQCL